MDRRIATVGVGSQAEGPCRYPNIYNRIQEHVRAVEHGSQTSIILGEGKGQNTNDNSYSLTQGALKVIPTLMGKRMGNHENIPGE